MSSLRHKFRFMFVMVAFQAPLISPGFDASVVYPTNDWQVAFYDRLVIPGETISLFNSTFTNISDSSPFVVLSDDGDFLVADVVSGERFRVRVNVGNSPEQARERMMDRFSMCAAIQPFPRLVLDGRELGDRAYKGWGTNAVNSASFVRNNVFVDLFADQESSTVVPLAMLLDDAVLVLSGVTGHGTRGMSGERIKDLPFDRHNADVIAAMGLTGLPPSTNVPAWFMPSNFVFDAISVSAEQVNPDSMLLNRPHRLHFSNGAEPVLCQAYPPLGSNNVARVLGNAIGSPSNLPAEMFAAMFSVETYHSGLVVIEPRKGYSSRDFVVAIFNDAIIRVDTSATNRIELALALLRAGGVDIPGEPEEEPPDDANE